MSLMRADVSWMTCTRHIIVMATQLSPAGHLLLLGPPSLLRENVAQRRQCEQEPQVLDLEISIHLVTIYRYLAVY